LEPLAKTDDNLPFLIKSYLTLIERTLEDFRIAFVLKPEPQDANVVIVGITEDTPRNFIHDLIHFRKTLRFMNPRGV
jgi:hypothetical protein